MKKRKLNERMGDIEILTTALCNFQEKRGIVDTMRILQMCLLATATGMVGEDDATKEEGEEMLREFIEDTIKKFHRNCDDVIEKAKKRKGGL